MRAGRQGWETARGRRRGGGVREERWDKWRARVGTDGGAGANGEMEEADWGRETAADSCHNKLAEASSRLKPQQEVG